MSAEPQRGPKLTFAEARHRVEGVAAAVCLIPRATESVSLRQAGRRVLAETVFADRDFPSFARSTRDGYALRSLDAAEPPVLLTVIGEIRAGAPNALTLRAGQAAEIMTGAPVPAGADSVVMVEHTTSLAGNRVRINHSVASGANIVPQAAEAKRGQSLLAAGTPLHPAAIGAAAAAGLTHLQVYRQPRIAIIATGDEIVPLESSPEPSQIRNSNSYALAAQVELAGGMPVLLPIAPDEPARLGQLVRQGFDFELLLLSGGVSVGKYDLVKQVLGELGAKLLFAGVKIQPGGPVAFGRRQEQYFFALPGNPVSTMVTFELFVRPLLAALSGMAPPKLRFLQARLQGELTVQPGLTRFLPAALSGEFEATEVEPVPWQGSGDLAANALSNCYLVVPPDRDCLRKGEWVAVMLR